jgi:hypothetical protein
MYKVYWTDKNSNLSSGMIITKLREALRVCNDQRELGHMFVTMVSDYADMVGEPGAKGAGSEYVPQLKS